MIFENILGNINDIENIDDFHLEVIYLDSDDLVKKIIRVRSDHNKEYGIALKNTNEQLEDGSILFKENNNIIVIKINNEDAIIIQPKDINEMGEIAHLLGNTHIPIDIKNGEIILKYDHVIEKIIKYKNIKYSIESIKLGKALRHVDYSHHH